MRIVLVASSGLYVLGFALMFVMQTQMPVTFGLALVRSAAWPVSVATRSMWPHGAPQKMD
jgi:hypothetical protein